MAQHLTIEEKPDVLIPVPLHLNRLRKRGYNQALELAKIITQHTRIPLNNEACIRYRDTPPQAHLSGEQRQNNLRNAFKIGRVKSHWQHIVIVDDVVTTGTTVHEIARIFLEQTAIQKLEVWCCARA
jgi:ComF family protein